MPYNPSPLSSNAHSRTTSPFKPVEGMVALLAVFTRAVAKSDEAYTAEQALLRSITNFNSTLNLIVSKLKYECLAQPLIDDLNLMLKDVEAQSKIMASIDANICHRLLLQWPVVLAKYHEHAFSNNEGDDATIAMLHKEIIRCQEFIAKALEECLDLIREHSIGPQSSCRF